MNIFLERRKMNIRDVENIQSTMYARKACTYMHTWRVTNNTSGSPPVRTLIMKCRLLGAPAQIDEFSYKKRGRMRRIEPGQLTSCTNREGTIGSSFLHIAFLQYAEQKCNV